MKTVLVLEDDPSVMGVFRAVLSRAGYAVTEAIRGDQAERWAESNRDLYLLIADVTPPCSGAEVSVRIKVFIPSVKIVLTSGRPPDLWSAGDASLLRELRSDGVRLLPKPFVCTDVLSLVDELIGPPAKATRARVGQ